MKKWFVVLCFSCISVTAFAQLDPHHAKQQEIFEQATASVFSKAQAVNFAGDPHATDLNIAVERKVAQAQKQAQEHKTVQPSWPDEQHEVEPVSSPTRPSCFAEDAAYKTCTQISACRVWAQEQAQKDVHFQVLSATLSVTADPHNQQLEVTYVETTDKQVKIFKKDFDGTWKAIN